MNDKQVTDRAFRVLSTGQGSFALEVVFQKTDLGRQGKGMVTSSYGT